MTTTPPLQPPIEATDIFSVSDQVLADRLQFIEEIGFGNWGSVWACQPKPDPASSSCVGPEPLHTKIAVKLVHRSKTPTTAARVRSLWNEMKVVRSLKHELHPSIIPFYSFIITPSYALITMAFHPRLVPVEVAEYHAKPWFHSLLSGVDFLHRRGVVHNDIKPANILLSSENVPVLVDFGFAERYELSASDAFHSNLSYGTPEYLSPERARGLPHDTRKSDIWSLGVTFFEILVGRTPFEHSEGEQFSTKADLERYWSRTIKGKWIGAYKMSASVEKVLQRMISPNADLRCTATEALAEPYWSSSTAPSVETQRRVPSLKRSSSVSVSVAATKRPMVDAPNVDVVCKEPTGRPKVEKERKVDKENSRNVSLLGLTREKSRSASALLRNTHTRSQSLVQTRSHEQTRKPVLSPARHTPPLRNASSSALKERRDRDKENVLANANGATRAARKPFSPRKPTPPSSPAVFPAKRLASKVSNDENSPVVERKEKEKHKKRALADLTSGKVNVSRAKKESKQECVNDRMREWEREKQRIREMEAVEERLREAEAIREQQRRQQEEELRQEIERQHELELEMEKQREREAESERLRKIEEDRQREEERQRELERGREESERARVRDVLAYHGLSLNTRLATPPGTPGCQGPTPLSPLIEEPSGYDIEIEARSGTESGLSVLKQSFKLSLDMTKRLYKSSTQALLSASTSPRQRSVSSSATSSPHNSIRSAAGSRQSAGEGAWEDVEITRHAKSSLPVVRNAVHSEEVAAANQLDRMTIWIKNVEKVVEDARQNFAAASSTTLPPLPVAPISRRASAEHRTRPSLSSTPSAPSVLPCATANRSSRVPRRILAANHIFDAEYAGAAVEDDDEEASSTNEKDASVVYRRSWMTLAKNTSVGDSTYQTAPCMPSEGPSQGSMFPPSAFSSDSFVPGTPAHHRRRATIVTRSPEANRELRIDTNVAVDLSPSKRREKSRSQNDLSFSRLGRPITPVTRLEFEIEQLSRPAPVPRLSSIVDSSLFFSDPTPRSLRPEPSFDAGRNRFSDMRLSTQNQNSISTPQNDLTASPHLVQPYPSRPQSKVSMSADLDTPGRKHLEGVYDRFLMSTTGVKRVGKGYQSEVKAEIPATSKSLGPSKRSQNFFLSTRRAMPPPVSSEDLRVRKVASVSEFGAGRNKDVKGSKESSIVKRALKAISVKR